MSMKTCAQCGNFIEEAEELCPDCRNALTGRRKPRRLPTIRRAINHRQRMHSSAPRYCPFCGVYLQYRDARFCPACHGALTSAPGEVSRPVVEASDDPRLSFQLLPGSYLQQDKPEFSGRHRLLIILGGIALLLLACVFLLPHLGSWLGCSSSLPRAGQLPKSDHDPVTILDDHTEKDVRGIVCVVGTLRSNRNAPVDVSIDYEVDDAAHNTISHATLRICDIPPDTPQRFKRISAVSGTGKPPATVISEPRRSMCRLRKRSPRG